MWLEHTLWYILSSCDKQNYQTFKDLWEFFALFTMQEEHIDQTVDCITSCRTPELDIQGYELYDEVREKKIEEEQYRRSQSRASSTSEMSRYLSSPLSDSSRSFSSKLLYGKGGVLLRKRTRSVSRLQEIFTEPEEFYCCNKDLKNLKTYTQHQIMLHNFLAPYYCEECSQSFLTQDHLNMHQRTEKAHETLRSICVMCKTELKNIFELQEHLKLHFEYSVPCIYCDLTFLSKGMCERHVIKDHKGKKKRNRARRIYINEYPVRRTPVPNKGNKSIAETHGLQNHSLVQTEKSVQENVSRTGANLIVNIKKLDLINLTTQKSSTQIQSQPSLQRNGIVQRVQILKKAMPHNGFTGLEENIL